MKSNYKRLGDYIRQVDVRNSDLTVNKLLGLSISKEFIPSIANTIGTDMSTYKIVKPYQFAYVPVTSRNGEKITVSLYKGNEDCIISQAYIVFDIIDNEELLPEYLMMWFRRPEFDRYARFKSHGSAREVFEWDEMCNVLLSVPPIEEQRKIAEEYKALEQRIANNNRLIATLESTAQTIYKKMFVDDIDEENLPNGWRMGKIKDIANCSYGKMPNLKNKGNIPVFSGYGVVGSCEEEMFSKQHIIVIARGDSGSGRVVRSPKKFFLTNLAIAILLKDERYREYLYQYLQTQDTYSLRTGSAQAQVTINNLEDFDIMIPPLSKCEDYYNTVTYLYKYIDLIKKEEKVLTTILSLLLTKLTKI
ncbi:MAG: restriction endonuclease subunit S [Prevotella sp.]|nr:restriction endonuclease subunit S [Prevotella sp.]